MDEAVRALEREFKRVANDLEYATHCFEAAFKSSDYPDVVTLMRRMQSIQARISAAKVRSDNLRHERQELVTRVVASVLTNHHALQTMVRESNCPTDEDWGAAESALHSSISNCDFVSPNLQYEATQALSSTHQTVENNENQPESNTDHSQVPPILGKVASQRPAIKDTVTQEEFESVPSNVRGRAKFDDVVRAYEKILRHHRQHAAQARKTRNKQPPVITRKELDSAGIKVTGLTGEAVLATLRHLNMIKMVKDGYCINVLGR